MKTSLLILSMAAALAMFAGGCGSTGGETTNAGDTSDTNDTTTLPPGACNNDNQCTGTGERCMSDGTGSEYFTCGVPNVGGKEIDEPCAANSECLLNSCKSGFCAGPDTNPDGIIVGTGGNCSWVDEPDACMSWKCFYEAGKTICRHNAQAIPNGNVEWTCVDDSGQTVCLYTGTGVPGSGEVPNTDPSWMCQYSDATDTTTCINTADMPDSNPGWVCAFPEDGGGGVKVCERLGGGPTNPNCDVGNIEGYACTPSQDAVSGATVTLDYTDCDGNPAHLSIESDALGYFVIPNIPVGTWTLDVSKGPYERTEDVTVAAGQTTSFTDGSPRLCFDPSETRIAVVGGAYDSIGAVLTELGFNYDFYAGTTNWDGWEFLMDAAALDTYDIVFINCGVHPEANYVAYMNDLQTIGANLRNFVDAGHYIYASDWAYYFVEAAFPDKIDFRGQDLTPMDVLVGERGIHAVAVTNVELQAYTGINATTIDLNLPQWAVVSGVAADVTTYLRGDAKIVSSGGGGVDPNVPFLVDFRSGSGSVAYTSYHIHQNEAVNDFFAFIAMNFK